MYVHLSLLSTSTNFVIFTVIFLAIIDDSESTVPLLNDTGNGSIPINDTQEEREQNQHHEDNPLVEGAQDKSDSAVI